MDIGLDQLNTMLLDMASLSQSAVAAAIDAYTQAAKPADVRKMSDRLQALNRQVSDLAMEVIARYQPVATDLRFIKACMEISYGFFRYGRYALDIVQVMEIFGELGKCDRSQVTETAKLTQDMIRMSADAFARRDVNLARQIPDMDDAVDEKYRSNLRRIMESKANPRCNLANILTMRYLERIADHAAYIAESVDYIVTGVEPPD
jgi:phosphate transport system protein